jgi:hypothetical protein
MFFALGYITSDGFAASISSMLSPAGGGGIDIAHTGWAIFGIGLLSVFGAAFVLKYPRASTYLYAFAFIAAVICTILIGVDNGSIGEFIVKLWPFAAASALLAVFSYYGDIEAKREKTSA